MPCRWHYSVIKHAKRCDLFAVIAENNLIVVDQCRGIFNQWKGSKSGTAHVAFLNPDFSDGGFDPDSEKFGKSKSVSQLNRIFRAGFDTSGAIDAVACLVAECTHERVFTIRDGF